MLKTVSTLILFSLLILSTQAGPAAAEEINKNFHQTFDVKQGDSLRLRHGDGNVRLIPWEKNVIDVSVRYRADIDAVGIRLGRKEDFVVEFRQTGTTVYVTGKETSRGTIGFYNKKVYEHIYEIQAPDYIQLDLHGDDGDVNISGWAANIDCMIDDGDIAMQDIKGDKITIRGEDGDIEIEDLAGDLSIQLDDGDVTLMGCAVPRCRLEADDGNIEISEAQGSFDMAVDDGNIRMRKTAATELILRADDGDVDLDLLAVEDFDADIRTDDGDVTIDLEPGFSLSFHTTADDVDYIRIDLDGIENYREDEHSKSGRLGDGEGRLKIRTADGDITIR